MRGGEGKGLRVCAGARVSLLHTRDRHLPPPPLPSSLRARFHRFCTNAPLSSYTDRFSFFPPSFRALLPFPTRAFFRVFFYFPTIIIPSNFAHSKRWRKFVEVTPRETRRIPNKAGLFIRYEANVLSCKRYRGSFECIHLLNAIVA